MDKFITTETAKVYKDFRGNICCPDKDNKALLEKATHDRESKGLAKGLSRLGSIHSEDALTWSVFRSLELASQMDLFYNLNGISDDLDTTIFWTRDTKTGAVDNMLQQILDHVEVPQHWKQQTEPDVIVKGKRIVIFAECKLGKRGEKVLGWKRDKPFEHRHYRYREKGFLDNIFNEEFKRNFEQAARRFYQLMRNSIIGYRYAKRHDLEFHLCVVVNDLNFAENGQTHREEFEGFKKYLIAGSKVHLVTWQSIGEAISGKAELAGLYDYMTSHACLT
ncbi:hypothetical protein KAW55_01400 [bacterium]|nr:hypothetical protein [bacterium]